jgi:hypothetical protein
MAKLMGDGIWEVGLVPYRNRWTISMSVENCRTPLNEEREEIGEEKIVAHTGS